MHKQACIHAQTRMHTCPQPPQHTHTHIHIPCHLSDPAVYVVPYTPQSGEQEESHHDREENPKGEERNIELSHLLRLMEQILLLPFSS